MAMGYPLKPTLANIFLCYHEKMWLQNCPSDFKHVSVIVFDHFDIIASDGNKFRLRIMESLFIKCDQPQLNKTMKSFP